MKDYITQIRKLMTEYNRHETTLNAIEDFFRLDKPKKFIFRDASLLDILKYRAATIQDMEAVASEIKKLKKELTANKSIYKDQYQELVRLTNEEICSAIKEERAR